MQTLGLDSDIRFIKVGTRSSTQKIYTAPVKPPIFHPDGPWAKLPVIHSFIHSSIHPWNVHVDTFIVLKINGIQILNWPCWGG
jgi:hypothetical protein